MLLKIVSNQLVALQFSFQIDPPLPFNLFKTYSIKSLSSGSSSKRFRQLHVSASIKSSLQISLEQNFFVPDELASIFMKLKRLTSYQGKFK